MFFTELHSLVYLLHCTDNHALYNIFKAIPYFMTAAYLLIVILQYTTSSANIQSTTSLYATSNLSLFPRSIPNLLVFSHFLSFMRSAISLHLPNDILALQTS